MQNRPIAGDAGSPYSFLVGAIVNGAGLAAGSLTVAGLGAAGARVLAYVVVETLRASE
jgi:hypothetical protein